MTTTNDLTMKNLLCQMPNALAHVNVTLGPFENKKIEEIQWVEFRERKQNPRKTDVGYQLFRDNGFHMVIPVNDLEQFVRNLANATANKIASMNPHFKRNYPTA